MPRPGSGSGSGPVSDVRPVDGSGPQVRKRPVDGQERPIGSRDLGNAVNVNDKSHPVLLTGSPVKGKPRATVPKIDDEGTFAPHASDDDKVLSKLFGI